MQLRHLALAAGVLVTSAGVLVTSAGPSHAQEAERGASVALRVYADDDAVTVWSPSASASAGLGERLAVEAAVTVDVLSAASVDVTSTASPYPFEEERVEGGLTLSWQPARLHTLSVRAVGSTENDFDALRIGAGYRTEVAQRNTTLDVAWTAALDTVGRAGDASFARARRGQRLALTLTQTLDARTYLDVVVDGERQTGYLASPYRYVPVVDASGAARYSLPEAVPDERAGLAALVRVRRALASRWFVQADYRLYRDDWGITSHTASGQGVVALGDEDRVLVGVHARAYQQGAASFYESSYVDDGAGAPSWRTRDRSLGGMRSTTLGTSVSARVPVADARLSLSLSWMHFSWLDYALQDDRDALVASTGVWIPW